MIEGLADVLLHNGVLGAVCLFFMIKDIRVNNHITQTLDRIAIIIDERIPKD